MFYFLDNSGVSLYECLQRYRRAPDATYNYKPVEKIFSRAIMKIRFSIEKIFSSLCNFIDYLF